MKPSTDREEATREQARSAKELPTATLSKTATDAPTRAHPTTDKVAPIRKKFRSDTELPT
jgi:hypothetical protein